MVVALVFFSVKMSTGIQDFTMRWQNGVIDELVDRLDEQDFSAAKTSVLGDESILAAPLDVTLLDFSSPNAAERGKLDAQLVAEIRAELESGVERGGRGSRLFWARLLVASAQRVAAFSWRPRPSARWSSSRAEPGSHSRVY